MSYSSSGQTWSGSTIDGPVAFSDDYNKGDELWPLIDSRKCIKEENSNMLEHEDTASYSTKCTFIYSEWNIVWSAEERTTAIHCIYLKYSQCNAVLHILLLLVSSARIQWPCIVLGCTGRLVYNSTQDRTRILYNSTTVQHYMNEQQSLWLIFTTLGGSVRLQDNQEDQIQSHQG